MTMEQLTDAALKHLRMSETNEDGENVKGVKDEFLASLVGVFGPDKGLQLYQDGECSEKDLTALVALLEKFGLPGLTPPEGESTVEMDAEPEPAKDETPADDPPKDEKDPEVNMSKTIEKIVDARFSKLEKQISGVLSSLKMHNKPVTDPPKEEPPKPTAKCRPDGKILAFQPVNKE